MSDQFIVVSNPTRRRKWGWAWCCTPDGHGPYSIHAPTGPMYTGTLRQVSDAIAADRTLQSLRGGGAFYTTQWFYNGTPILNVDVEDLLQDIEFERNYPYLMYEPITSVDLQPVRASTLEVTP